MIDLSEVERAYIADLLERRYEELMHEMHHTASRKFRDGLKEEIEMVERLRHSIAPAVADLPGS